MVKSCCAWGCTNRQVKGSGLGFFRIPTDDERRCKWVQAIHREGWEPSKNDRLCGAHFVTGKPHVTDKTHPDYVPSIFKFRDLEASTKKSGDALHRFERTLKRRKLVLTPTEEESANDVIDDLNDSESESEINSKTTQTEGDCDIVQENLLLTNEVNNLRLERDRLKDELQKLQFSWKNLTEDDKKTSFYTGLQSFKVLDCLYSYVDKKVNVAETKLSKLHYKDEILLLLMKLRLNLSFEDLGDRFSISQSTASRIFHKWLPILHEMLEPLIRWPDKETTIQTLPSGFQKHFRKVRCIIDCSDIFIEKPTAFKARSQTYSNYKKHNTVKVLIGITPNGSISFRSKCFGGKISDKEITRRSGFYDKLEYGDHVMADRGFLIRDELALHGCELIIPSFTLGKKQLTQEEVEISRRLSRVRIHIERIIGLMKIKYTILGGTLPITLVKRNGDSEFATIDKIVTVCAALTNLSEPVV